jgi:hypothetical protein
MGCASTGGGKLQPVNLPPPPGCMAPVGVPTIKAGDDARSALARSRGALKQANGNLTCSRKWYDGVRKNYGSTTGRR